MQDETIAPPPPPATRPIAHWSHTLALCLLLVLTATFGHARGGTGALEAASHLVRYGTSILFEWVLLGAVIGGIYCRRDFFLRAFHHPERSLAESFGLGAATYLAGTAAVLVLGVALHFTPLGAKRNPEVVLAMLPHSALEYVLWFCVSLTAGICEELIFRGYLLQQFTAWTRRPFVALLLTSLLFGGVHLYEGLGAILPLAALALVYGLCVQRFRGDLRAVIIAHTLQDFLVAILAAAALHLKQFAHQ